MDSQSPCEFMNEDDGIFKIPATPKKKRIVATITPLKKKEQIQPYDEALLARTFGAYALNNIVLDEKEPQQTGAIKDLKNFRFRFLKNNFIIKVNGGEEVECFQSSNGAIALFNVNDDTVNLLNQLLSYLLHKFPADPRFAITEVEKGATLFIRPDRLSSFFNMDGSRLELLPQTGFRGNVALKVIGLQFYNGNEGAKTVKLLIHVSQIRVTGRGCGGGREGEEPCMFN